jgi:hypothetical protein
MPIYAYVYTLQAESRQDSHTYLTHVCVRVVLPSCIQAQAIEIWYKLSCHLSCSINHATRILCTQLPTSSTGMTSVKAISSVGNAQTPS